MNYAFLIKHKRVLFYSAWALLALLQASFTQLQDDEAYYWVYAKFLDWGYFDHPPMIALFIKLGTALFSHHLGVRLLPVIFNTLTLFVTEKLLDGKTKGLFYIICLSLLSLQLAGFWAVPDNPLIFFTALFFLCYKNFLARSSWRNAIWLGVVTACLLYSKYHGVLVIFFTLLSNLQLFKNRKIYGAGLIAVLLFLPHLVWQSQNNWISFRYHLFENKVHPYQPLFTIDYLFGQLLIAGPLTGIITLGSVFFCRARDAFFKALKYTGIGIYVFFALSSLRGQVEANWTAPALIPLVVLTYHFTQSHTKWRAWLLRLLPVNLLIVFFVRMVMIVDLLPIPAIVERFHSWKGWPLELKEKTQGLPVAFNNSYQRASMYWFYTGQTTYSLNGYRERRNSYNFWPVEDSLLGKPVYNFDIYNVSAFQDSIQATLWKVGFTYIPVFNSFGKIMINTNANEYQINQNDSLAIRLTTLLPAAYKTYLVNNPSINQPVRVGIYKGQEWIKDAPCSLDLRALLQGPHQVFSLRPDVEKGTYYFEFAIGSSTGIFTHNSNKIVLRVK